MVSHNVQSTIPLLTDSSDRLRADDIGYDYIYIVNPFPVTNMSNRFRRALKTAALLPVRAAKGSNRGFTPVQGELPIVVLRVHVVGCSNLISKDKNGLSDPWVVNFSFKNPSLSPL